MPALSKKEILRHLNTRLDLLRDDYDALVEINDTDRAILAKSRILELKSIIGYLENSL